MGQEAPTRRCVAAPPGYVASAGRAPGCGCAAAGAPRLWPWAARGPGREPIGRPGRGRALARSQLLGAQMGRSCPLRNGPRDGPVAQSPFETDRTRCHSAGSGRTLASTERSTTYCEWCARRRALCQTCAGTRARGNAIENNSKRHGTNFLPAWGPRTAMRREISRARNSILGCDRLEAEVL